MYLANFKTFFIFLSIVAKKRRLFSNFLKLFFSALCDYVTFFFDLSSFFFSEPNYEAIDESESRDGNLLTRGKNL